MPITPISIKAKQTNKLTKLYICIWFESPLNKGVYLNNTRMPLEHMKLKNTLIFRKIYKTHEKVSETHESIFNFYGISSLKTPFKNFFY